jgi:DNA mismatch repair protein MutS2
VSEHALEVLEFGRVLECVAARAASDLARDRILASRPETDPATISRELGRVGAAMRFVEEDPDWGMFPVPDLTNTLEQLSAEGVLLEPMQLHSAAVLLNSSRRLSAEFEARDGCYPELLTVAQLLVSRREIEDTIGRCVDGEGRVLDGASRKLQKIRSKLRGAHARIVKRLEAFVTTLPERFVVSDGSVTIRDGRYVIPVRREGKSEVGGIVHDESQSGATLFVEPPAAIALMNEVREVEREERREIRSILGELTVEITQERDTLRGVLDALVDFDSIHARARTALSWRAAVPEVADSENLTLHIRDGRHPLLLENDPMSVVPFELELNEGERAVVVSGPNTGGKSVFLKATGLICTLAQSGVVPPVGRGTRLRVFDSFFADIGDEQSIVQSLSTFSAHLANLSAIVTGAGPRSLVLIDEMGTGTDPAEGAALARAVLEELVVRKATTIVSSHLGELKRLDGDGSGIVNASLQFDADQMAPTYRFLKGRPGRSYGLTIARRLGFPAEVIDRAETYREDDGARMEETLARLEHLEREAEKLVHQLDLEHAQSARLKKGMEGRERMLRNFERDADDRAQKGARILLLEARAEVEAAILELRTSFEQGADLEESTRQARRRVEQAADRYRKTRSEARGSGRPVDIEVGDRVRIQATGALGAVIELRSGRAVVEAGAVRLEVTVSELEVVDAPPPQPEVRAGGWSAPSRGQARLEVDLRGLRVDEMEIELSRALDDAILEDLAELRIIHGKGTGALRKRVTEMLDDDARVAVHRMGDPREGGSGVTVASFGGAL